MGLPPPIRVNDMETKESIVALAKMPNCSTEMFQKIVSALRGPDSVDGSDNDYNTSLLKQFTTSRIRAIVAPGYYGDTRIKKLSQMEMRLRGILLEYAPHHFASHYKEAVNAIKVVFKYDLKAEKEVNDKPKGSSQVDNSDGSGIGADFRKTGSWLCDLQQSKAAETNLVEGVLGAEPVQLLE
jgi:hypothetical protein